MRKLITIILGLFLILSVNAQYRDSIIQFRHDFMNVKVDPLDEMRINFNNPALKPALILVGTFIINHFIIRHDERQHNFEYTSRKTGTIYLIGMTACTLTFAFEMKKYNNEQKLYHR